VTSRKHWSVTRPWQPWLKRGFAQKCFFVAGRGIGWAICTYTYICIYIFIFISLDAAACYRGGGVLDVRLYAKPTYMIYIHMYIYSYIFIYICNQAFRIDSFIVWHMSCDNNNTDFFGSHSKTNVTSPLWHMSCDNNRCNLFWIVSACQQKNLKSDAFILWYMSFDIRHKKVRDGHETVT